MTSELGPPGPPTRIIRWYNTQEEESNLSVSYYNDLLYLRVQGPNKGILTVMGLEPMTF